MKINKFFYKLVVSFVLVIANHTQSSQNSKFNIFAIFQKQGKDEVDFLRAYKHQTILQGDAINLGGHGQTCPNYPK